jgi:hypothetical protein
MPTITVSDEFIEQARRVGEWYRARNVDVVDRKGGGIDVNAVLEQHVTDKLAEIAVIGKLGDVDRFRASWIDAADSRTQQLPVIRDEPDDADDQ